jgi:hypothetical protein
LPLKTRRTAGFFMPVLSARIRAFRSRMQMLQKNHLSAPAAGAVIDAAIQIGDRSGK